MILIQVLCVFSSFCGILANPLNAFDQSIMELLKMKPGQIPPKKVGQKFSLFGNIPGADMRPWNLQGYEMGKPVISRPFQPVASPVLANRFQMAQPVYDPTQANKMHIQPYAPFSDQKDAYQSYTTDIKTQDSPRFPDPQGIAVNSFPGDINTAALHAMNMRNPNIPNFDVKSFLSNQSPEHQRKVQQQLRDFGTNNQELGSMKMMKKPENFDGMNVNDSFQMQKQFNRGNRENQGFSDGQDFSAFLPGRSS